MVQTIAAVKSPDTLAASLSRHYDGMMLTVIHKVRTCTMRGPHRNTRIATKPKGYSLPAHASMLDMLHHHTSAAAPRLDVQRRDVCNPRAAPHRCRAHVRGVVHVVHV